MVGATTRPPSPAGHRRARRQRADARVLLRLGSAAQRLGEHHSAQTAALMPGWAQYGKAGGKKGSSPSKAYVVCAAPGCRHGSGPSWVYCDRIAASPFCIGCGTAWPTSTVPVSRGSAMETPAVQARTFLEALCSPAPAAGKGTADGAHGSSTQGAGNPPAGIPEKATAAGQPPGVEAKEGRPKDEGGKPQFGPCTQQALGGQVDSMPQFFAVLVGIMRQDPTKLEPGFIVAQLEEHFKKAAATSAGPVD